MSLDELIRVVWRRRALFVGAFAAMLAAAAIITFSLPKIYSSTAYLWVNPSRAVASDFDAVQLSQFLTRSYAELLQTRSVSQQVAARLPFEMSEKKVHDSVEIAPVSESQLLRISAEAEDRSEARTIAQTYANVFIERARRLSEQGTTESRVTIAEAATLPRSPVRPRPALYLAVSGLVALLVALAAALLRERLDRRVRVDEATTELFGLPVLGRIPRTSGGALAGAMLGRKQERQHSTALHEAFLVLLTNLSFAGSPRTITVTSPLEREGKSTCVLGLGRAAVEHGMAAAVVEADLRRPGLLPEMGMYLQGGAEGFSHCLSGSTEVEEALISVPGGGSVMPSGPIPLNPTALLRSPAFRAAHASLRQRFDLVLFDTPPVSVGADAVLVGTETEGVILVIDVTATSRVAVERALDELRRARANVLGLVLNRFAEARRSYYYGTGRQVIQRPRDKAEDGSRDRPEQKRPVRTARGH